MATTGRLPREPVKRARLRSFHELMRRRVQRILLVSSLYDSFIMSEEGQLHETLLSHFMELNLNTVPDLIQVSNAAEALRLLGEGDGFDLVVTSLKSVGDADSASLVRRLREAGHEVPVMALAYTSGELSDYLARHREHVFERIFLWQGDVRIFLAMVMVLEDRLNVANDTGEMGVPCILVVEDNVRFYSSFLPVIYAELFRHTHRLLSEDLNLSQRMMRMRARPKVLLAETYEEAWAYFERYREQVIGVVSDFEYPRGGALDRRAGLDFCSRVLEARPDVRLVLQSSVPENRTAAEELGASFLLKGSPFLLQELRTVLVERFGFGDFIFRLPDGTEVDRARDLRSLGVKLETVPAESIGYHAERNHFSNWLKARTEFALAERLRPQQVSDFESLESLRRYLLENIARSRLERQRTFIAEFDRKRFEPEVSLTRIGGGSLGGKARGVAFANRILVSARLEQRFPGLDVYVPPAIVLGTEVFDEFLAYGGLREFATGDHPDEEIERYFVEAPFPRIAVAKLRHFLERVKYPLAVRSSSLLEDSLSQPFAGVYRTYMLANNDPVLDVRWLQLSTAVKRVFASVFTKQAKAYLSMTSYRLEEEKMGVMIQRLTGVARGERFYPDFAGVARSHNFYPEPGHAPEDGVVAVALGMGHTVVGGERCLRFCPRYPTQLVSFSSVRDALEGSQREFYALDLTRDERSAGIPPLAKLPLEAAEEDGPLRWLGSTWTPDDNRVVDGISREGTRLVSFAQVLKHGAFPLADILNELLELCSEGTGGPVEIEFAGNLGGADRRGELAFLQLRPLAVSREPGDVEIGPVDAAAVVCRSSRVLGNGRIDDVVDLVVVDAHGFVRRKSPEVAVDVARFDAVLRKEGRPYVLVGVGRWGSADPHLGIPVGWNQIAGACVIVEAGFEDMRVAPSQGTHFFQNLTSSNVGYFTVNPDAGEGSLDWEWVESLPCVERTELVRRIRLERPLRIRIDGRSGEGVILRPEPDGGA